MSFLDELLNARESPVPVYHEFLLRYERVNDVIHVFVEGHDDVSFYQGFLAALVPHTHTVEFYRCGKKATVYETRRIIRDGGHEGVATLFVVDKDLSDYLEEDWPIASDVYVTDYYSIENYVVSVDMLRRVWNEIFRFRNISFKFETIATKFSEELSAFHRWALSVTAWIIWLRRHDQTPMINDMDMGKICAFDSSLTFHAASLLDTLQALDDLCKVATPTECVAQIDDIERSLAERDPKTYVRGKFELWFFVKFLSSLEATMRALALDKEQGVRVLTQLNERNAMEILGPRTPMPPSFREFVLRNLNSA